MAVLYLSLASFNLDLHAPLRQVSFRSMQFMLISLQSEEASTYSIFVKCNLDAPLPWMPGLSPRLNSPPSARHWSVVNLETAEFVFNLSTLKKHFR